MRGREHPRGLSVHQKDRTNHHMALIVEQGVARDLLYGSVMAWKFMASQGVPERVIARVLTDPGARRHSDSLASHGHNTPAGGQRPMAD